MPDQPDNLHVDGNLTTTGVVDTDGDGTPDTVHMTDSAGNKIDGHINSDGTIDYTENGQHVASIDAADPTGHAGAADPTGANADHTATPTPASAPAGAGGDHTPAAQPADTHDLTPADQAVPADPNITSGAPYDPATDHQPAPAQPPAADHQPAPAQQPATDHQPAPGQQPTAGAPNPPQPAADTHTETHTETHTTTDTTTDTHSAPETHAPDTHAPDTHATTDTHTGPDDSTVSATVDGQGNVTLTESDGDHGGVPDLAAHFTPDGQLHEVDTFDAAGHIQTETIDTNHDGSPDVTLVDSTGDGHFDTEILDQDHDHIPDTVVHLDPSGAVTGTDYVYGGPDGQHVDASSPAGPDMPTMPFTEEFEEFNHGTGDHTDVHDDHHGM